MKKLILLLALIQVSFLNLKAQNFLINQDFSTTTGSTPPTGWTNNMLSGVSGLDNWVFGKHPKFFFAPPIDDKYAIFDSYNGGSAGGTATNGQSENVALQSPAVSTVGLSNLFFSFDFMELYNGGLGYLEISIDDGANWTTYTSFTSVTSVPVAVLYDFGSYIGYTKFKVRFRWDNSPNYTYSGYMAIDNVKLYSRYSTDATITALDPMYDKSCPSAAQQVNIVIRNAGSSSISNVPVVVNVSGAATATLNYTYSGTIGVNSSVNVNVGSINTTSGGNVVFSATVNYSGDVNTSNDNFTTTRVSAAIAGNPTAIDGSACQRGSRVSIGATKSAGDSTFWYDQASGGPIIGQGNPFLTPPINGTTTFYAQNARLFNNEQWAFQGPYRFNGIQYSGSYFNISAVNDILIDSFWQHFAYAGAYNVSVYYKTGTYSGFESNSTAWTLHQTVSIVTNGYGHMVGLKLKNPLNIPAGNLYGFYILVDGLTTQKCITFKNAIVNFSNADVTVATGVVSSAQFAGVTSGYSWDGRVFYRKLCLSSRVGVKAIIKPSPVGASIASSTPFEGKLKVGDASSPDLMEINQTNAYELTPPTGYTNAGHNVTWKVNSIILRTRSGVNGVIVPGSEYTYTPPSSGVNAKVTFKGLSKYLDSNIFISFNFSDLGPHFCDSTVLRVVRIVPAPKPDFSFTNPACDGTPISFDNLSTIHSGDMSYKWYFGDGDSSDGKNAVHIYKTYGCYLVKLRATSFPWGIIKDTSILVCITEVPVVKFKVVNACEGIPVKFLNQTTIGSGTLNYTWIYGDNSPDGNAANPTHLYTLAGGYQVTLKVSANGCESSLTKNAYQFAIPVANFTAPSSSVCENSEVTFPNNTTISRGDEGAFWSYGDGKSSTLRNGYNIYNAPGTYNVKLKSISEFGCSDSITKQVQIKPSPTPDFITNKLCSGEPTNFLNTTVETVANPTYTWTISDNSNYFTKNITKNWSNEGHYSATLKVDFTNGCSGSVTKDLVVLLQPKADFNVKDICSGEIANFVNLTSGDKGNIDYLWDFGNGTGSEGSPKRLYNPPVTTTYTISLAASYKFGCSDTIVKVLTVSQSPVCDFSVKNQGFLNYQFTPSNSTYSKYEWFFGEGGTSVTTSPIYRFAYPSGFHVRMVATNAAGCKCEITKFVTATTSVKDITSNNGLNIYPNPNTGIFTITSKGLNGMKIEVYNLLGSRILSQVTTENTVNINLGDVSKGIYLVKVTMDGVTTTTKVTVTD